MKLKIADSDWKVTRDGDGTLEIKANRFYVATIHGAVPHDTVNGHTPPDTREANALAMSRVPKMLAFIAAHTHDEGGYRCPERFKCERCDEARALLEGLVGE